MASNAGGRMTTRGLANTGDITIGSAVDSLFGTSDITIAGRILLAACAFLAEDKEYLDHVLLGVGLDVLEQCGSPEPGLRVFFQCRRQADGVITDDRKIISGIVSERIAGTLAPDGAGQCRMWWLDRYYGASNACEVIEQRYKCACYCHY